jgi:hypothetical protein
MFIMHIVIIALRRLIRYPNYIMLRGQLSDLIHLKLKNYLGTQFLTLLLKVSSDV